MTTGKIVMLLFQRAEWILEAAKNSAHFREGQNRLEEMRIHLGYAKPGYGLRYYDCSYYPQKA